MTAGLTVVIPAYNEQAAIQAGKLAEARTWLFDHWPGPFELVVVDDGSTDRTARAASAWGRVVRTAHRGKAAAVMAGVADAEFKWVLVTDMDQATPMHATTDVVLQLIQGYQFAVGDRGLRRPGAPAWRAAVSLGMVGMRRALLGPGLPVDTQCGFKAFRRSAALDVIQHLRVYAPTKLCVEKCAHVSAGFDVEFLYTALMLGYRVASVPVPWKHQASGRVRARDAWRGAADLMRIRRAWRK